MIVRGARRPGMDDIVDLGIEDGVIVPAELAGGDVLDADGRWVLPGLWDQHVHFAMWARSRSRLDLSATSSAAGVLAAVRGAEAGPSPLVGFGYRRAGWPDDARVDDLDAVTGDRPTVMIAGDAHSAWLNTAAQRLLGLSAVSGLLEEDGWFAVAGDLDTGLGLGAVTDTELVAAQREAAALGVVGVVDYEFDSAWRAWPARVARGVDLLRVRAACYADTLDAVIAAGHRTGDVLDPTGLVTMGSLKCISDGSLGTLTAHCREQYPRGGHGSQNVGPDQLTALLARGHGHGLTAAVHAIGDAAVGIALDAFEASGARGSIEHAQLALPDDVARLARPGLRASVQPAHLLDDRPLAARAWPGRDRHCFPLRSMLAAGVELVLGSDAPVAALDPWLAIRAATERGRPGDEPWTPEERITRTEALAASCDGRTLAVGEPADLVLLDHDPLITERPGVAHTLVGGRSTHGAA